MISNGPTGKKKAWENLINPVFLGQNWHFVLCHLNGTHLKERERKTERETEIVVSSGKIHFCCIIRRYSITGETRIRFSLFWNSGQSLSAHPFDSSYLSRWRRVKTVFQPFADERHQQESNKQESKMDFSNKFAEFMLETRVHHNQVVQ